MERKRQLKETGERLPLAYLENFVCILYKSEIPELIEPLEDKDLSEIRSIFTDGSLKEFGQKLHEILGDQWLNHAWLYPLNEDDIANLYQGYWKVRPIMRAMKVNHKTFDNLVALRHMFDKYQKGQKRDKNYIKQLIDNINPQMNYDELFDVTVTEDFGFNSQGQKQFLCNNKSFTVQLDNHLIPMLYDEHNNFIKSLPRAKKNDDKKLLEKQKEEYKALKKQLKDFYKLHEKRFITEFHKHAIRHYHHAKQYWLSNPLIKQMAESLVWGLYENIGTKKEFRCGFIIHHDEWLNSDYEDIINLYQLEQSAYDSYHIALLHPAQLNQKQHHDLKSMITDFEQIPVFEQMDSPICTLLADGKPQKIDYFQDCVFDEDIFDKAFSEIIGRSWHGDKNTTSTSYIGYESSGNYNDPYTYEGISYILDGGHKVDVYFKERVTSIRDADSDAIAIIDYIDIADCHNIYKLNKALMCLLENLK